MRIRWDIVGALLAVPGFVVIACVLAWEPLTDWAECSLVGLETRCPPTVSGAVARLVGTVVTLTYVFSFVGIGMLPPIYSLLWTLRMVARRYGWPVTIGAVLGLAVLAGVAGRLGQERGREALIGLVAFAIVGGLIWRAVRRRRAPPVA